LIFLWSLCCLAQAGVLLYVWKIHKTFAPAREWGTGALLTVPGLLFIGLRDIIPLWASVIVANGFILYGRMLFNYGVMHAAGRRPSWIFGHMLCGVAVVLLIWFSLVDPDFPSRAVVFNTALILLDGLTVASCLTYAGTGPTATFRILAAVFALHILSCLWRTLEAMVDHIPSLFSPALAQSQYFVFSIVSTMVVTTLLVLLTAQKRQKELYEQARHDPLTKACNRRTLDEIVSCQWQNAAQFDEPVTCLMLDIDDFKGFNDRYGHQAGDAALVAVSAAARSMLRAEDTWCRFGGEEFLALLPNIDARQALIVADRLREKIASLALGEPGSNERVTVSIGVADARAGTVSWTDLVGRCDRALYKAKTSGRNRVEVAEENLDTASLPGLVRLAWDEAYACGQESIDNQHRRLFEVANTLLTALLTGWPKTACQELIDMLLSDVLVHFRDEEAILSAAGYPGTDEHAVIHTELLAKAKTLAQRYHDDVLTIGEVFKFLVTDVVSRHMLVDDQKFYPWLARRANATPTAAEKHQT
jgi:diguanylate cyclase (GGDEF)-like protein/hemerythrin-like metal-binding protein